MKKIRVGVFGVGRGTDLAREFMFLDVEIVAICEGNKERREAAMANFDKSVVAYESFDEFIEHPMDAVILANNFYQHVPFAIECFKRNIHVFSECIANATMGEGVELVRAFEKSKSIYLLAENYPELRPSAASIRPVTPVWLSTSSPTMQTIEKPFSTFNGLSLPSEISYAKHLSAASFAFSASFSETAMHIV